MVLWPERDRQLSRFVGWLTLTHTQRWHAYRGSVGSGHVYQGRFQSFPVAADDHLWTVCRYVERNAVRAGLVDSAEQWPWGSLRQRREEGAGGPVRAAPPLPLPGDWEGWVNRPQTW